MPEYLATERHRNDPPTACMSEGSSNLPSGPIHTLVIISTENPLCSYLGRADRVPAPASHLEKSSIKNSCHLLPNENRNQTLQFLNWGPVHDQLMLHDGIYCLYSIGIYLRIGKRIAWVPAFNNWSWPASETEGKP